MVHLQPRINRIWTKSKNLHQILRWTLTTLQRISLQMFKPQLQRKVAAVHQLKSQLLPQLQPRAHLTSPSFHRTKCNSTWHSSNKWMGCKIMVIWWAKCLPKCKSSKLNRQPQRHKKEKRRPQFSNRSIQCRCKTCSIRWTWESEEISSATSSKIISEFKW